MGSQPFFWGLFFGVVPFNRTPELTAGFDDPWGFALDQQSMEARAFEERRRSLARARLPRPPLERIHMGK
jgi:hypothetical protein